MLILDILPLFTVAIYECFLCLKVSEAKAFEPHTRPEREDLHISYMNLDEHDFSHAHCHFSERLG